jgi:hypothetical protein
MTAFDPVSAPDMIVATEPNRSASRIASMASMTLTTAR